MIEYTCNSAKLNRSDHEIPGAPHHMTQVYFTPGVLNAFENRNEFTVERTRELGCTHVLRSLVVCDRWALRIAYDPDEPDEGTMVRLGDLGNCLPCVVRKHFREFNIAPP